MGNRGLVAKPPQPTGKGSQKGLEESHDNATLGDKLVMSTRDDPSISDADRWKMGKLGAALLFTSQGIPFLESGQEWWRSKGNCENSYDARGTRSPIAQPQGYITHKLLTITIFIVIV